jgi:6-phosphofructo-2-kinase/fructose-2,6-biphosphatase 2
MFLLYIDVEALQKRALAAQEALDDMLKWFANDNGQVAVYDATNTTKERRDMIYRACQMEGVDVQLIVISIDMSSVFVY